MSLVRPSCFAAALGCLALAPPVSAASVGLCESAGLTGDRWTEIYGPEGKLVTLAITGEAIAVTRDIARYRGLVTVLVHTDILGHKLDFTREYIAALHDTAWFDTVGNYGKWWAARDTVAVNVTEAPDGERSVRVSVDGSIEGLTLELPEGWTYLRGLDGSRQQDRLLTLGSLSGMATLEFEVVREAIIQAQ